MCWYSRAICLRSDHMKATLRDGPGHGESHNVSEDPPQRIIVKVAAPLEPVLPGDEFAPPKVETHVYELIDVLDTSIGGRRAGYVWAREAREIGTSQVGIWRSPHSLQVLTAESRQGR